MPETIFSTECTDKSGTFQYDVRVLHMFGAVNGYLNAKKIAELWKEASKHDVLFSDYTQGKVEPFLSVLMNPSSIWLELYKEGTGPIGVAYINRVIPNFDALGHFAFWDRTAVGREPLVWGIMRWMFDEFNLHRISAETPPYQAGVIRFIKRLGFQQEGQRRESILHKGKWMPLSEFGIVIDEFDTLMNSKEVNSRAEG